MQFEDLSLGVCSRFNSWSLFISSFIAPQQLDEFGSISLFSRFLNQLHLFIFGSAYIMLLVLNMGDLRAKSMQ
jgi:hypothetical protein